MELETEVGATLLIGLRGGTAKLPAANGLGFDALLTTTLSLVAELLLAFATALETPVATDLLAVPSGILCTVS